MGDPRPSKSLLRHIHRLSSMSNPGMATRLGGGRAMRGADWRPTTCQFIAGEPKDREFCGKPVKPGSSYCAEHHEICWYPPAKAEGDDA